MYITFCVGFRAPAIAENPFGALLVFDASNDFVDAVIKVNLKKMVTEFVEVLFINET